MKERIMRSYRFYVKYVNKTDTVTLAYYFILGMVPMITLMTGIFKLIGIDVTVIANTLSSILPSNISGTIASFFFDRKVSTISYLTLAICTYVASKGTYRMILTVDKMYHVRQEMSLLSLQIHAIFDIFLIMALFTAAIFGFAFLPALFKAYGWGQYLLLSKIIAILMVYIMLVIIYKVVPSIHVRFRDCLVGAAAAIALFFAITIFYKIYLSFAQMSNAYGTFAAYAFMLMSVEFFCQAIYFGFAVNALLYIE